LISNAVANYAGQITIVAVGFLLTPFIINDLGTAMYGVWALVVSIQGLGGLLDFGVTTSVIKYVAEHHARGETNEINKVASSSFLLHSFIGLGAFAVLALASWLALPLLNLDPQQLAVARSSLLVAGASLMLMLPLGVPGNLLVGLRRYEASNIINIVQTVLSAGVILFALGLGGGPTELIAINGISLVMAYIAKWFFAARALPGLRISYRMADWATLRRIGGYSVWLFLLDIAKRIFYNADAVLIAAFLPVSAVTTYNLGFKPASAVSYLSGPLVSVFLPAASEMQALKQTEVLRRLLLTGTRIALSLTLAGVLWLLAFGRQAIEVWIGPGHEDVLPVLYIFLGVFLVSAAQNPSGAILKGIGQVKALSIAVLTEYAANILISILLIPKLGVSGAAVGTLIPAVINDLVVIPWLVCRALDVNYRGFLLKVLPAPVATGVATLALLLPLSSILNNGSILNLVLGGVATLFLFGLFYILFGISAEERVLLKERLVRFAGRIGYHNRDSRVGVTSKDNGTKDAEAKHPNTNAQPKREAPLDSTEPQPADRKQ
jgi:O-antigen/teichoic acid export membrane protein